MTAHLTSQQVTAYRSGVSPPEELLRLDDHLAACEDCRSLLAQAGEGVGTAIRMLRLDLSSAHLTEGQLDDYAARRPMAADLVQHLDLCPDCRADAEDLREFAGTAPVDQSEIKPIWVRALAAAMAVTALGVAAWLAIRSHSPAVPSSPVQTASKVPAQYQAEIQTAIDSGVLHIPASIAGMTGGPIQLRSETKASAPSAFHLISPTATAVIDDTPIFRWTALEGATYSISVYDDHFNQVAAAAGLQTTEWHPDKPFPRAAAYLWEVRAVRGAHTERAPAGTQPEARFAVLSGADAQRLAEARTAMPDDPLALGILYADAGAIADARTALEQAASSNDAQQKSAAEKLLGQLK
jgi:Putative zinc-finger